MIKFILKPANEQNKHQSEELEHNQEENSKENKDNEYEKASRVKRRVEELTNN